MPKKHKGGHGSQLRKHQDHAKNKQLRKALRRQRDARKYLNENDKSFISLNLQLKTRGLKLKQILGDGNCLFRSLADQYEQDHTKHWQYRAEVCQFILDNAPDFRPWVEDEMSLENFVRELSKDGVFGGNETLVAFSRLKNVDIVIHQLDEMPWVIEAKPGVSAKISLHLAYHNEEDHYSSVVPGLFGEEARPLPPVKIQSQTKSQSKSEFKAYTSTKSFQDPDYLYQQEFNPYSVDQIILSKSDLPQPNIYSLGEGVDTKSSFEEDLAQLMQTTGCQDKSTLCQALEDNNWEVSAAIVQVLQIMALTDEFASLPTTAPVKNSDLKPDPSISKEKPKQYQQQQHPQAKNPPSKKQQSAQPKLSNKKRKELAKAERKSRRTESQKKDGGKQDDHPHPYFDDDDDFNEGFQGFYIKRFD